MDPECKMMDPMGLYIRINSFEIPVAFQVSMCFIIRAVPKADLLGKEGMHFVPEVFISEAEADAIKVSVCLHCFLLLFLLINSRTRQLRPGHLGLGPGCCEQSGCRRV
jgi:hypothetical protein